MSTRTKRRTDRLALRVVGPGDPIRARFSESIPPAIPSPSCAGGAHRRCLLTAEQCCCPHHSDPDFVYEKPPARAIPAFSCPACAMSLPSADARAEHMRHDHPVSTHDDDDDDQAPASVSRLHAVESPERHRIAKCRSRKCAICYGDPPVEPKPRGGIWRCSDCDNLPFLSERSRNIHRAIAHDEPWPERRAR